MCHGCKSKRTPVNPNQWKPIPTKVILLGSSQSGKTSLMLQYVCGVFRQSEEKWIRKLFSLLFSPSNPIFRKPWQHEKALDNTR